MYPQDTYPFWGRADERIYDISFGNPPLDRGEILIVKGECDELGKFLVLYTENTGDGFYVSYASITPLCQVCEEADAAGMGIYHPTTLLCQACLDAEDTCEPAWCDHGHLAEDVRRFPHIVGDGAILCCKLHYDSEMAYRRECGFDWQTPSWDSLQPYTGA